MNSIRVLVLAIVFPLLSFTVLHKYYVSLTEIEYVKEKKSVQIISRIFIDDFEKLLRERYDKSITLAIENEKESVNFYTKKYLKEKLKIEINNKPVVFNFLGKEYEDDMILCYLEIENIRHFSKIRVVNQILYEIYPGQQNIVRIKTDSINKSILLTKENDKGLLKL